MKAMKIVSYVRQANVERRGSGRLCAITPRPRLKAVKWTACDRHHSLPMWRSAKMKGQ